MKTKIRKLTGEEKMAILNNLLAHGLVSKIFNLDKGFVEFKMTLEGYKTYATILDILNRKKILSGPKLSNDEIDFYSLERIKNMVIEQKFIDQIPSGESHLTERGAEHIKMMFSLDNDTGIWSRFKKLKG